MTQASHSKSNITRKFIAYLAIFSVLPLIFIGVVSYHLSTDTIKKQAVRAAQTNVDNSRDILDLKLSQIDSLLTDISGVEAITNSLTIKENSDNTYSRLATKAQIGYILNGYLNIEGVISISIYTVSGINYHVGESISPRTYREYVKNKLFKDTSNHHGFIYWAGVKDNISLNSSYPKVLSVSSVIYDVDLETMRQNPAALLVINYDLKEFGKNLDRGYETESGFYLITDQHGRFITHPNSELIGSIASAELIETIEGGSKAGTTSVNDEEMIVNSAAFARNGWMIARFVPLKTLTQPANAIRTTTFSIIIGCIIIIIFAGYHFSQKIVVPIKNVTDAFKAFEKGALDPNKKIVAKGNDEIAELAIWFNTFLNLTKAQREAKLALEESENKFKDFTEASSDWFWETDENHRFIVMSDRFFETVHVDRKAVVGQTRLNVYETFKDLDIDFDWNEHLHDLEQRRPFEVTYPLFGVETEIVYIRSNGKPIFDSKGKFKGYRGTGTDVSQEVFAKKKLLELNRTLEDRILDRTKDLRDAKERAEQANRTKSEFLSNMSHELRTPLNAIIGFSEVIKNQILGPIGNSNYKEYAADIHASGTFLLEIINDILDVSRIEVSQLELEEETINLQKTFASLKAMTRPKADAKSIKFVVKVDKNMPEVHVDARRIKQIFLNLITNAIKFTPSGGKIKIDAHLDSEGNIEVIVADSGIGIENSNREKIFEPFGKVENSMVREYEGIGLGLPIVKSLLELHGGSIELLPSDEIGSTFKVILPKSRIV